MRGQIGLLLVLFGLQLLGCGNAGPLREAVDAPPAQEGPDEPEPSETPKGYLAFTPERLDFGVVTPGSEETRPVVVRNLGEAGLFLHSLSPAAPFKAAIESLYLAPGEAHAFSIAFAPPIPGDYESVAGFVTKDDRRIFRLEVAGSGWVEGLEPGPGKPSLWVQPALLDFGEVPAAAHPGSLYLEIQNISQERADVALSLDSSAFSLRPESLALDAGEHERVEVWLSLGGAGDVESTLTIRACPTCEPILVPVVTRKVEPRPHAVPPELDFGAVAMGGEATRNLMIHADRSPTIVDLVQILPEAAPFTVEGWPQAEPDFEHPLYLKVHFQPTVPGPHEGRLLVRMGEHIGEVPLRGFAE